MTTTPAELISEARSFMPDLTDAAIALAGALPDDDPSELENPLAHAAFEAALRLRGAEAMIDRLAAALEAAQAGPTQEGASGRMFTNEVGQTVSLWVHSLPSGQHSLQMTRGRALPEGIEALSNMELRALADVATRAAQPTQGSGDYVLVPREPTKAMRRAAFDALELNYPFGGHNNGTKARDAVYRAMISAATPAEGERE